MVASEAAPQRSHRRWPISEKRRIVELTLVQGASISAIARAHAVHLNSLLQWRKLYAAGKLVVGESRATRELQLKTTLLPVTIAQSDLVAKRASTLSISSQHAGIVQLTFPCGTAVRIESHMLDVTMICALIAQVQR